MSADRKLSHFFNWPNRITLIRIGMTIPILVLLRFPNPVTCWLAAILFGLAAATDFLDGYLARRDSQITNFGKFLDPLADKILICSILIDMVRLGWAPSWVAVIIVVRELAVTGLRAVAADEGVVIAADKFGKLKTILQIVALVPLLIHYPVFGLPTALSGQIILYIALALTLFSGLNYFYRFYQDWENTKD